LEAAAAVRRSRTRSGTGLCIAACSRVSVVAVPSAQRGAAQGRAGGVGIRSVVETGERGEIERGKLSW